LHAAAAGHPFVGAGAYPRPCRAGPLLACNGHMHTEPQLNVAITPQLGRYDIDPSQSAVTFRTRHLFGLAPVRGTFAIRGGTVDIAGPVTASAVCAEIETASFRTASSQRDRTVLSPRFLNPAEYPVITFASGRIDAGTGVVTGTLTVAETSRPISLSIVHYAPSAGSFTGRATTRVDRTEYGVTAMRGLAGRYLDITVEVRCVHK
jgi:polyisoprenoid-binding protein YceI